MCVDSIIITNLVRAELVLQFIKCWIELIILFLSPFDAFIYLLTKFLTKFEKDTVEVG